MRVLIIGGTGFIGPNVVAQLVKTGHAVTLFHRGKTEAELPQGVRHIYGDRRNLADFSHQLRRLAPDVALDMFPYCEEDARTVLESLRGIVCRVVTISSQDVYRAYGKVVRIESGPLEPLPLTEDSPLRTRLNPYRSDPPREAGDPLQWLDRYEKILVEQAVMNDPDIQGTVLRLPMVYGQGDNQHRLFRYLKRMDDGRPAIILDEGLATWRSTRGYVGNVGAAVATAVADERASGRIYNVGESEPLSMADWVKKIGGAAGWSGEIAVVPRERLPSTLIAEMNTDQDLVVDTSRIRDELNYKDPVDQHESLRRTIAWERTHPPAKADPQMFDYTAEDAVLDGLKRDP